jgi:hypothetical protein
MAIFTEEELRAAARILFAVHQRRAQERAEREDDEGAESPRPPYGDSRL